MAEMGRPPLWKDPADLKALVDSYFESTDRPTLSGLAVFLGTDRHTIYNYKEKDNFFHIIKEATDKVSAAYEERLIYENNPTGVIFALKNMGWKDKTEVDQSLSIHWEEEKTYDK